MSSASPSASCPAVNTGRRRWLAGALAAPWLLGQGAAQAQQATLQIGQSAALTGPLGELGQAMRHGAQAGFAVVNQRGGVHGRQIVLTTLDDGYEVARAVANVTQLLARPDCFALFGCMGTPTVQATLAQVKAAGVPLFAPFTGSQSTRTAGARHVFNIRASYADEVQKILQHLSTLGLKRVGVVTQANSFGQEVLDEVQAGAARLKLSLVAKARVRDDGVDAQETARQMASAAPEAIVMGLAGTAALSFVQSFRPINTSTALYAMSVHGTPASLNALRTHAKDMAITQVVPMPEGGNAPLVREFQQAWQALGQPEEPSHVALEGYINARAFAEALQRAGKNPTRAAFIDATWSLQQWDMGGFQVNASTPEHSASRFVELTMVVGRAGQLRR